MRLFDKCVLQGPQEIRDALKRKPPVVFAIDEIASHYYMNEQMEWGSDDYPYAKPPWTHCFIEWNEPPEMLAPEGLVKCNPTHQCGLAIEYFEKEGCVAGTLKLLSTLCTMTSNLDIPSDVAATAMLTPMSFANGRINSFETQMVWFLTADGRIMRTAYFGPGLEKLKNSIGQAEAQKCFDTLTHITALAFTFSNCANVKLEDVTEELQPPAKIMRRLKLPCVKRYTLNIAGHVARPRRDSGDPIQTGVMPFHLCRGHFATYTAEKPLFGRHVGKFWIPPHTKGREERGRIEKDYAVKNS